MLSGEFPFKEFFADWNRDLFNAEETFDVNLDIAQGCFRDIQQIFTQLEEFPSLELELIEEKICWSKKRRSLPRLVLTRHYSNIDSIVATAQFRSAGRNRLETVRYDR